MCRVVQNFYLERSIPTFHSFFVFTNVLSTRMPLCSSGTALETSGGVLSFIFFFILLQTSTIHRILSNTYDFSRHIYIQCEHETNMCILLDFRFVHTHSHTHIVAFARGLVSIFDSLLFFFFALHSDKIQSVVHSAVSTVAKADTSRKIENFGRTM